MVPHRGGKSFSVGFFEFKKSLFGQGAVAIIPRSFERTKTKEYIFLEKTASRLPRRKSLKAVENWLEAEKLGVRGVNEAG